MEDTNKPFISNGTTIYGKRTTQIQAEIKAIYDGYTETQKEHLLMECARRQWFIDEHAPYWYGKESLKPSTGDKK